MTEPGIYYPAVLTGDQLDSFLAKGWYRMGQGIFTTHFVIQDDNLYRVYWLRYNLNLLSKSDSSKKIIKINRHFTTSILPLNISAELEELYAHYKSALSFNPAASVQQWLLEEQTNNVYDTTMIEVRDQGKLIAAGIFDKGRHSIAGILNFYHPGYKKYSLGKYLMLLKIEYALAEGIQWYYPGYIVQGYPKFDYKLFADKNAAELFIPEQNQWCRYEDGLIENNK